MRMFAGVAPALRIARRDALRHRSRSLLIIALIALPVLAITTADLWVRSSTATPAERADSTLGRLADASLAAPAGHLTTSQYSPEDTYFNFNDGSGNGVDVSTLPLRPPAEVLAVLPAGAQITPWKSTHVPVKELDGRYFSTAAETLDLNAPAAAGRFAVLSGVAPSGPGQVALTADLAGRLGAKIGSVISIGAPATSMTVVGLLESLIPTLGSPRGPVAVTAFGQLRYSAEYDGPQYLERGAALSWDDVVALNTHGIGAFSRQALLNPPADVSSSTKTENNTLLIAGGIVGLIIAVMQVVFLAGPAFAVGARRMRRQLGQLGATGGSPRQIGAVVVAGGLVLGTLGSAVGVFLGLAVGLAAKSFAVQHLGLRYLATHIHLADLAAIFGLGILTAVIAALIPGISATRMNLVTALSRNPAGVKSAGWWSIAGAVLCAGGLALTLVVAWTKISEADRDSAGPSRALMIGIGLLLAEVGLVMATPLLLQAVSRLGSLVSTVPRLALRDVARHRGRSAPAVAAVMTVTAAAVAITSLLATVEKNHASSYQPSQPVGSVYISKFDAVEVQGQKLVTQAEKAWPGAGIALVQRLSDAQGSIGADPVVPPANKCPWSMSNIHYTDDNSTTPTAAELPRARTDWRCAGATYSTVTPAQAGTHPAGADLGTSPSANVSYSGAPAGTVVVTDAAGRRLLTGVDDPAADATLNRGGTVLLDRAYAGTGNTLSLEVSHYDLTNQAQVTDRTVVVPATMGRWSESAYTAILSAAAAEKAGLPVTFDSLKVFPRAPASQQQADQFTVDLAAAAGYNLWTSIETGSYSSSEASPWLIFGVAALLIALTSAVVTALTVADAREDLSTLGAVGAGGWTRRRFSGWSALLVTGIGCILGGALGLVPAFGLVRLVYQTGGFDQPFFEIPWGPMITVAVALPILAFVVAAGVTRSRISLVRTAD